MAPIIVNVNCVAVHSIAVSMPLFIVGLGCFVTFFFVIITTNTVLVTLSYTNGHEKS